MPHLDPSAVQCIIAIAKEYLTSLQKTESHTNMVNAEIAALGRQVFESKSRLNNEIAYNNKQEELILMQRNYIDSLHGELLIYKEVDTRQTIEATPGFRFQPNRAGSIDLTDIALPLPPICRSDALLEAGNKPTKEFLNADQLDNGQNNSQRCENGYPSLDIIGSLM